MHKKEKQGVDLVMYDWTDKTRKERNGKSKIKKEKNRKADTP